MLENKNNPIGYRICGGFYYPPSNVLQEAFLERVKMVRGLGRWIYCKYCYKSVRPLLSGVNQIICSECGYGLTPDFLNFQNLIHWLKFGEDLETKK